MKNGLITVIDVMRDMNVEITKELTWGVGQIVARRWYDEVGTEPEKLNRTKTSGEGVHAFAHYPTRWRPVIEEAIRSHRVEASRQMDLFNATATP
jgi:hypothetical protein